ncbi:phosphoglycerate dehydrogenase-like enzyme [Oikeobacillus pervagus]|uniref:Phosphoglycerate dehydrogenase-like enzyme n=1 Tax=Oikeobacillus pervagus TaxID=1325931 RepID=A0AAJ1T808_9BACI|nr:D-2-hydroxyacid dehydrogenase [Oikeobacillus pervagus]MDQ0216831.1 phosphoglycerate dehydrogenase-like enzyme [Oikeobacillus pervagus]
MVKILFTFRPPTYLREQLLKKFPQCDFSFYKTIGEAEELQKAEILVTYGEDLTSKHIDECSQLKWIMVASAGLEKMPFEAIHKKQIFVTNARGIHKIPMAEFTLGLMLSHVKRFPELAHLEQNATWNKKLPLQELAGKRLLILGTGAIGSEIARLSQAFRMDVMGVNRSGRQVEFFSGIYQLDHMKEPLQTADFIVSVLPSTKETKYVLTEEHFHIMKETAVFINIGRGDLVRERVLHQALKEGQIEHAYIDVFETEPLSKDHPFWKMPNLTVTPHISSITKNYLPRAFDIFLHNLNAYLHKKDDFLNLIDVEKGY